MPEEWLILGWHGARTDPQERSMPSWQLMLAWPSSQTHGRAASTRWSYRCQHHRRQQLWRLHRQIHNTGERLSSMAWRQGWSCRSCACGNGLEGRGRRQMQTIRRRISFSSPLHWHRDQQTPVQVWRPGHHRQSRRLWNASLPAPSSRRWQTSPLTYHRTVPWEPRHVPLTVTH